MTSFRLNRLSFLWIASAVVLLSSFAAASLVNNLTVNNSTGTGLTYSVQSSAFAVGALQYVDRTYKFASPEPSVLLNQTYIETANGDKAVLPGNSTFMTFTLGQSATVYVAHDDRVLVRPTWLTANFMDTGLTVMGGASTAVPFEVFVNSYPAGAVVTLGSNIPANGNNQNSMYTVIVVPTATDTSAPTAPSTLQATCKSAIVVGLNWNKSTDNVGVAGYRIVRGGNVIATVSGTVPDATLYYSDLTVAASTAYSYVVKAFDAAGNSTSSVTLPVTTPPASALGDAAYCSSTKIASMTFNWSSAFTQAVSAGGTEPPHSDSSDLWNVTWAADGSYAFFGDGYGLCGQLDTLSGGGPNTADETSFGIAKMTGPATGGACQAEFSNVYGGYHSSHPFSGSQLQGKASSLIAIGSNFYAIANTWPSNGQLQKGGPNHYEIAHSDGNPNTWQSNATNWEFCAADANGNPTSGAFCPGSFVNYGKAVANPDGYVYMTATPNTFGFWCNTGCPAFVPPANTYMMRVPSGSILTQNAYQYYAGLDNNAKPIWTTNSSLVKPIFSDRNANKTDSRGVSYVMAEGLGQPVYNPVVGRYIAPAVSGDLGQTSFYDSPNPWGPWTVISYNNVNLANEDSNHLPTGGWGNFGVATPGGLGVNGVAAWTSADGKTVYFTFSGSAGAAATTADFVALQGKNMDVFSYVNATLTLR
jgi:hypothetical protein